MIENTNLKNDMAHAFSRRNMIMPPATVEDAAQAEGKHVGDDPTVTAVTGKDFKGVAINYEIEDCLGITYTDFDGITGGKEYVDDYGVTWFDKADQSIFIYSSESYTPLLVWDTENFALTTEQVPVKKAVKQMTRVTATASTIDPSTDKLTINSYMLFNHVGSDPFTLYIINGYRWQVYGNTSEGYVKVLKVNPEDHSEIISEVASIQILDGAASHNMVSANGATLKIPITAGAGCYLVTFATKNSSSASMYMGGIIVAPQKSTATAEVTLSSGTKSEHEVIFND